MPRYNNYSGSGTGSGKEFNDTILKLQKYAAISGAVGRVAAADTDYGDRFIVGLDDVAVIDGIVMQRDDDPDTWKVFGFGDLGFNVGEDGLVYEGYDAEAEEFTGQMSAEDIFEHARVQGLSETFGSDTYFYTPVGVVVEADQDVALNDDLEVEQTTVGSTADDRDESVGIEVGETSMLLGNKSWVRTAAKLLTETGNDIVATEEDENENTVPISDDWEWLTVEEPELRSDLEDREVELFVIEESQTFDGEEVTYSTPILLDVKTGERITIDNDAEDLESSDDGGDEADAEPVAADGGAATADSSESETVSPAEAGTNLDDPDETDVESESDDWPEVLDELIDYFARTQAGDVSPEEFKEFAADEVENPDDVDWQAAVDEAKRRA